MRNDYLQNIAADILRLQKEGISKVRFAKYIYFVHKFLVKRQLVDTGNLEFIRMPLGPVPVGFMSLDRNTNIVKSIKQNALIYDSELYKINGGESMTTGFVKEIALIVKDLDNYPTSSLVQISHKEPSWLSHVNGQEYFITNEDLQKNFPGVKSVDPELEEGHLQASLVEGMIENIVEESTSLEYPGE